MKLWILYEKKKHNYRLPREKDNIILNYVCVEDIKHIDHQYQHEGLNYLIEEYSHDFLIT